MNSRGTKILQCTIINPVDDTSHHELEPITGKDIHKPNVKRFPPTEGLLMASVYPLNLKVPGGKSPLERWTDWYEQAVRHCLDYDDSAFPFLHWIAENPFSDVPPHKFSSHSGFAMKNLNREVRRAMQEFGNDALSSGVDYYDRVCKKTEGSEIELAVKNEAVYAKRELPWVVSGCHVLEELLDAKEAELAKMYVGILNARADNRSRDVLRYAEKIMYLAAPK